MLSVVSISVIASREQRWKHQNRPDRQTLRRLGGGNSQKTDLRCLPLADTAHGEADMNKHPIADACFDRVIIADDADQINLAPYP
jgi:hypothetical protein